jgi:hypothetical protein
MPDEYWWNFFRSGLACASDSGDIFCPEEGQLSEAGHAWWMLAKAPAAAG